ncbi:MAG TPA: cation:proton antiporter [Alphaproteobacteria bacterium]|nr:cation:proton antiporter [Alphaproteobacteria bacterium]
MNKRILAGLFFLLVPAIALAAEGHGPAGNGVGGSAEVILVAQVALLMLIGRGLGEVMQRIGQPAIIGQLLAGLVLGPSLFGWIAPHAHDLIFPKGAEQKSLITGIANMGVMMLLLLTGMETDLKLVRKVGAPAIAISATGVLVPFACGFTLGEFLPDSILPNPQLRLVTALFLGTALSISSIKIVAMVVREMNFMRRNLGQIIVSSAIMEDTVGWVIISITLGIAGAGGVAVGSLAKTVIGTALFLVFSYTIGRWLVFQLIRWVNDTFVSEYAVVTAILIVMCAMAMTTQAIGVNTVLGAFVAGVLVGESPILSQLIQDELRGFITAFMMPVFFGLSGLSADLTVLRDPHLFELTAGLVAIATFGKFTGAFFGGRIGGLSRAESLVVGCAMNARGSTEVIVASIGLTMGALTQNLYSMIVTMAVLTTMAMPPMLRWALSRLPVNKEEQKRLDAEKLDSKGFVSRLERLLIAGDESASGRFAARLAGFIAGQRGRPVTVLQLSPKSRADDTTLKTIVTDAAKSGHHAVEADEREDKRADIVARVEHGKPDEAIKVEAEKGFDLLVLGINRSIVASGGFSAVVSRIGTDFAGPIALVMAGEGQDASVAAEGFNILVPVNGTDAARHGAEFAFALSPPQASKITALHVASRKTADEKKPARARATSAGDRNKKAVLRDTTELGARYGFRAVETASHTDVAPDDAILEEAKRIDADLIVIGATRRVGDDLFLGETVANVLQEWDGPIVLVIAAREAVARENSAAA